MGRLADAGQWDLAAEMAPGIEREFERLVALGQTADGAGVVRIERHMVVLEGLIANLPSNAREAVQTVVDETPRRSREATDPGPNPRNPGGAARSLATIRLPRRPLYGTPPRQGRSARLRLIRRRR